MKEKRLFTSESVTEGHPDKISDQISDAILDAIIAQDPQARVAVETAVNTGLVFVFGEVTTSAYVDIQRIVRQKVAEIGYDRGKYGFDAENLAVMVSLDEQSPDIAMGVNQAIETRDDTNKVQEIGAGDQGLMFGFACDETEELMPLPISLAHRLALRLTQVRKEGTLDYLRPDGKTQVTVEYDENDQPLRVDTVVVSTQHSEEVDLSQLKEDILKLVVQPTLPDHLFDSETKIYINPTGRFTIGGPKGDSGLTGRKIIVDTYGGYARHGGGAFSGKDATKVDRSASYAARYVAKNLVAAGLAKQVEIQLAYAIGVAQPVSISVNTFNTSNHSDQALVDLIRKHFKLTPSGIIEMLNLRQPVYGKTAAYGHFGRLDQDFAWERTDKADLLRQEMQG